jgi:3-oxoacyl-[acyl-carrier-protein] synthase II
MKRRVVITGIGVIAPNGADTETFWRACLSGTTSVASIPDHWREYAEFASTLWAPLPSVDFPRFRISRIELMQQDRTALMAAAAAEQALAMAGLVLQLRDEKKNTYTLPSFDAARCGAAMGTGVGGIVSFSRNQDNHIQTPLIPFVNQEGRRLLRHPPRFHPFAVPMTMPNSAAASLGIRYGLTGPNTTFCNACAAGLVAIGHAYAAVARGSLDLALCGGTEFLDEGYGGIFRAFDIARTLVRDCADPAAANRPFDKRRSGFLFAQGGCAVLLIEEREAALRCGRVPLAEIKAYAESFDAYSVMALEPGGAAASRMILEACRDASVAPHEIDYINAHATGTIQNDDVESSIIEKIFGNRPLVNATKSLTGHAIAASGAIEAAVAALSIRDQTTHACKNLDDPVRPLNFVREPAAFPIRNALTHSFAFGGHNAALIMSNVS